MTLRDDVFNIIADIDEINRKLLRLSEHTPRYYVDQDRNNNAYCVNDKFRDSGFSESVVNGLSITTAERICAFYNKRWKIRLDRAMTALVLLGEIL